ncbi:MAG TPA: terminase family protein [Blastocatellia bacterium]
MSLHPPLLKTERAEFLVECLDLPKASGVEDAKWEHFQLAHLNDDSLFRIENKSRQIAWSFLIAMEAVAEAVLYGQSSFFVSINIDEAKEKIRYAKLVYENLQVGGMPKLKTDNQLELEFSNGARILSLPSKAPRGKPRFNVYLDEYAHVQHDRIIYTGALPVVSKGGRIRIGSSPFGASGVFWEIFTESMQPYPGYSRKRTPWWEVQAFCLNVREARRLAPQMLTAARVDLFGNDRIKAIYANMPEEDFRQEYEAEFVDETTAWISWDEIKANQDRDLLCAMATMRGSDRSGITDAIEQILTWLRANKVELAFGAGVDIGRTRNLTECFLIGKSTTNQYPLRLTLSLDNVGFDDQEGVLAEVLTKLPVFKMLIDRNGIGMNLAENLGRRFPVKAEGVDFTNATKQLWATGSKMLFQQKKVPIPVDRELAYQIHSIKKHVSPSKNLIFDTARNEKHHADKFWGHSLGLAAVNSSPSPIVNMRTFHRTAEEILGLD